MQEAFIDAEDMAEPAVDALTEDGHAGRCYELSGPRLMTFGDAVLDPGPPTATSVTCR
ncbi:hypothetical protein [Streptomyces galbus]|uniref:hypothetical protein n=1 Tax=Streptomyces gottesmaniae TaxID=3075518 RepID=UPI000AC4D4F7